jgi:hypothetical protein
MKGEPSLALLFEAIYPTCCEHFTSWVHPSMNTAFDVSAYGTWEFRNDGNICNHVYALRSYDTTFIGEGDYEDEKGNFYNTSEKPVENIIKAEAIYHSYSGGEAFKRYTTSDGKHFYSLWFD